ncbi:MAG: hypothetical protein V4501_02005 [Pseudomonadota bacterium]
MLNLRALEAEISAYYYSLPINNEDGIRKSIKRAFEFNAYSKHLTILNEFITSHYPEQSDLLDMFNDINVYKFLHDENDLWNKEFAALLKTLADYSVQLRTINQDSILYTKMRVILFNSIQLAEIFVTPDKDHAQQIKTNTPKIIALTETMQKTLVFVNNSQDFNARKGLFDAAQNLLNISVDANKLITIQDRLVEGVAYAACLIACAAILSIPILIAAAFSAPPLILSIAAFLVILSVAEAAAYLVQDCGFFQPAAKLNAMDEEIVKTVDSFADVCSPTKRGFFSGKKYLVDNTETKKVELAPTALLAA